MTSPLLSLPSSLLRLCLLHLPWHHRFTQCSRLCKRLQRSFAVYSTASDSDQCLLTPEHYGGLLKGSLSALAWFRSVRSVSLEGLGMFSVPPSLARLLPLPDGYGTGDESYLLDDGGAGQKLWVGHSPFESVRVLRCRDSALQTLLECGAPFQHLHTLCLTAHGYDRDTVSLPLPPMLFQLPNLTHVSLLNRSASLNHLSLLSLPRIEHLELSGTWQWPLAWVLHSSGEPPHPATVSTALRTLVLESDQPLLARDGFDYFMRALRESSAQPDNGLHTLQMSARLRAPGLTHLTAIQTLTSLDCSRSNLPHDYLQYFLTATSTATLPALVHFSTECCVLAPGIRSRLAEIDDPIDTPLDAVRDATRAFLRAYSQLLSCRLPLRAHLIADSAVVAAALTLPAAQRLHLCLSNDSTGAGHELNTDYGALFLKPALTSHASSLRSLLLDGVSIGEPDLALLLQSSPNLLELSLVCCPLLTTAVWLLVAESGRTLQRFVLRDVATELTEHDWRTAAQAYPRLAHLIAPKDSGDDNAMSGSGPWSHGAPFHNLQYVSVVLRTPSQRAVSGEGLRVLVSLLAEAPLLDGANIWPLPPVFEEQLARLRR